MSEKFVTVATYGTSVEAQLARGLLEAEGINAYLIGDLTADAFPGLSALGDQVALQVHEQDAPRAVSLLASAASATLHADWERQAEAGVWVCSVCGAAVGYDLSTCPACKTGREGIREGRAEASTDLKKPAERGKSSEAIQKPRDRLTADAPATAQGAEEEPGPQGRAGCVVALAGLLYPLWLLVR